MGRLFFTGDTHREYDYGKIFLFNRRMKEQGLTKDDILVVMGDWGGYWYGGKKDYKFIKEKWEALPFTTFVIFGNHENYDVIDERLPIDFGGSIALRISDSVYGAISGEVYNLNGKTCLCVNGANSHDVFYADGTRRRIEHESWWPQEEINDIAINRALNNIAIYKEVDYVLTHTGGSRIASALGFNPTPSDAQLDRVLENVKFDKHYCGHYHRDMNVDINSRILYNDIIEIF